tara:strand:+ start:1225 stop:2436 length:1212 start_codon:yes stop_codon:yes gene_type:complete
MAIPINQSTINQYGLNPKQITDIFKQNYSGVKKPMSFNPSGQPVARPNFNALNNGSNRSNYIYSNQPNPTSANPLLSMQLGNSRGTSRPSLLDTFKAKGSNLLGIFDDKARLGQAATAIAMLEGKSAADAAAYGQAISGSSPTTSKSVGALYNVVFTDQGERPGELTNEQVYSSNQKRIDEIALDPTIRLEKLADQTETLGGLKDGEMYVDDGKGGKKIMATEGGAVDADIRNELFFVQQDLQNMTVLTERITTNVDQILTLLKDNGLQGGTKLKLLLQASNVSELASEINSRIKTLKINNFISTIAAMRAASKTGGAVGSVSERELDALEKAIMALDPLSASFVTDLKSLKSQYKRQLAYTIDVAKTKSDNLNSRLMRKQPIEIGGSESDDEANYNFLIGGV